MELLKERRKNPAIVVGQKIKDRILSRDESLGGIIVEILGIQGSGKTSLLLSIASEITKNKNEIVFWRESTMSQCQFNRVKNWQIFIEEGLTIEFRDILSNQHQNVPITIFKDFNELMNFAKPGKLNVLYLKENKRYVDLIKFLRLYPGWQSLFIDEYEDLVPLRCKGEQWHINGEMATEFKNIRRGLLGVFCDTQNPGDIDWRVRSKIMCHIYLNGSKVDLLSPINQGAINALPIGQMFCDYGHALYGKGSFRAFPPRKPILVAYII